jgi:phosphoglycerate dehydrogenase-like enzyme
VRVLICKNVSRPEASGHQICTTSREEILSQLRGVDVVIPAGASIGRTEMQRGEFGLIHVLGVGVDTIDVDAATELGIWVARVDGAKTANSDSVAEHAVFLTLAVSRRINQCRKSLEARTVSTPTGTALVGTTACIVGIGNIGSRIARLLSAFGVRLIGVHPRAIHVEGVEFARTFQPGELKQAVAAADYVILSASAAKLDAPLIDAEVLDAMKPGSSLVNVARGRLVDERALLAALERGHIRGAGLDVFVEEPVDPDHPLLGHENVVATPHIAGRTELCNTRMWTFFRDNLERYERGIQLEGVVNDPKHPRRHLR